MFGADFDALQIIQNVMVGGHVDMQLVGNLKFGGGAVYSRRSLPSRTCRLSIWADPLPTPPRNATTAGA
jgi:hypothetical protein